MDLGHYLAAPRIENKHECTIDQELPDAAA